MGGVYRGYIYFTGEKMTEELKPKNYWQIVKDRVKEKISYNNNPLTISDYGYIVTEVLNEEERDRNRGKIFEVKKEKK